MSTSVDILNRKSNRNIVHKGFNDAVEMSLYEIVEKVTEHLFKSHTELLNKVSLGKIPERELVIAIEKEIGMNGFKMKNMSGSELAKEIKKHLLGYGPLDEYIMNEECSNIFLNGPSDVWVQIGRERIRTNLTFGNNDNLNSYIRTIQNALGGSLNSNDALVKFVDEKNRLRIICAIDPISHLNSTVVIRKHRQSSFTMHDLLVMGMFNEEIMDLLKRISDRGDVSIMFVGRGGAGKTTLMRAMIELFDFSNGFQKRLLVMEEHPELFLNRPNTQQFLTKREKGRSYTIEHFTDYGNLMSIDAYIFGEIRGAEALPFFDGAFAGNITWNTSHSLSADLAIPKMALNMKKAGVDIDISILERQLYESVDLVIHLDLFCINEIAEVDKANKCLNPIYKFKPKIKTPTFMEGEFIKLNSFKNSHLLDLNTGAEGESL